jgi:phospholipid N-methyltransferase
VENHAPPLTILEAGPGTGPVTAEILTLLRPQDRLVLAELNPDFVRILREKLQSDPVWAPYHGQVQLFDGPVQAVKASDFSAPAFDLIICGLPFTNFPAPLVQEIFSSFSAMAAPQAPLTWFEYIAVRRLRMTLSGPQDRNRLREVSEAMNLHRRQSPCGGTSRAVLVNVPPAWVHRITLNSSAGGI